MSDSVQTSAVRVGMQAECAVARGKTCDADRTLDTVATQGLVFDARMKILSLLIFSASIMGARATSTTYIAAVLAVVLLLLSTNGTRRKPPPSCAWCLPPAHGCLWYGSQALGWLCSA